MARKKWIALGLTIVIVIAGLSMWDLDGDGLMNILDGNPSQFNFPATAYAKGLISSNEILEKLSCLDSDLTLDGNETVFIDYLSDFEENQQNVIIQSFLADGKVSPEEMRQILFLNSFTKSDRVQMVSNASFFNFNLDGDSWSNYFEKFVSRTIYDVENDVYVIIMTEAGMEYGPIVDMFGILQKMRIPEENVYDLLSERNTSVDFAAAVDDLAERADKNDIVLFLINGEGSPGVFGFKEGIEMVPYTWFKEKMDKISSNYQVVILNSCYSGSSLPYLVGNDRFILTSVTDEQKSGFGIEHEFLKAFTNVLADEDSNGYVSLGEAAEYARKVSTFSGMTPQISDKGNIGSTSYLFELKLEK